MYIKRLLILTFLQLLSACAQESAKELPSDAAPAKVESDSSQEVQTRQDKEPVKNALSKTGKNDKATSIDPKVMYLLMAGELAGQRNQYQVALNSYMQAASQVEDSRVAERAAKIALFMQDNKKMDEAVHLWLKQDDKNLSAQSVAALSALRSGQKKAAVDHLQSLLKLDPAGFENTLLEIMKSLGDSEKADTINAVLSELAASNPNQAAIYFVQALVAIQTKDLVLAEQKLQQTLSLQPEWEKALVAQAQVAVMKGENGKAEDLLKQAVAKFPKDAKFKKMLAQLYIKNSKLPEAMAVYKELLNVNPDDGESALSLALLHLQKQEDGEAKNYLQALTKKPEWSGQAAFYLGKLAAKDAKRSEALTWFDSVSAGPFEGEAMMAAVSVLLEEGRFVEAEQRLVKIQEKFPQQRVRTLAMRAEIYNEQKQYEKAYRVLSDALLEMPGQKEFLYTRSLVADRMGNIASMEKDLRQLLKNDPDDAAALNALGYTLANKTSRLAEAEKYLKKAMQLQPDMAVVIDSYGWLLFKKGQYQEAKRYLARAYAKQSEPEIGGHLVEVEWKLGNKQEAQTLLDKLLSENPKDEYLLELKKRFSTGT